MKFGKMVKRRILTFTLLGISMLTACGVEQVPDEQKSGGFKTDTVITEELRGNTEENHKTQNEENYVQSEGAFYDGADLQGSVVEFTEQGFSLSVATILQENEGNVMVQAAPGAENEADLVEITYGESCEFQIITLDKIELTELSREDTNRENIKKNTNVLVFGNCQDTYHWKAERVVILRWQ